MNYRAALLGLIVPALVPVMASAQVSGIPDPPSPTALPLAWLGMSNDLFGDAILNNDDFRTAGIRAGAAWRGFVLGADMSMLTNRGRDGSEPRRTDDLSTTLGYAIYDDERAATLSGSRWRSLVLAGAGVRFVGDLHGQAIQNAVHSVTGAPPVSLPSDPGTNTDGLAYVYARSLWLVWPHARPSLAPVGDLALQAEGCALGSSGGERQGFLGAKAVLLGVQGAAWFGGRWEFHGGEAANYTAQRVAQHESGTWLLFGVSSNGLSTGPVDDPRPYVALYLEAALNPRSKATNGTIGVEVKPAPGRMVTTPSRFDQSLIYLQGGAIGAQIRWQPRLLAGHGLSPRDVVFLDYHFGSPRGYADFTGNVVDANQMIAGWQPTWVWHPLRNLLSEWWLAAGAGVRQERVRPYGAIAAPRFPKTTHATTAIAQGGAGVRFGWDRGQEDQRLWQKMRVGVGYDGWYTANNATVSNGSDHAEFLQPGHAYELSLSAELRW